VCRVRKSDVLENMKGFHIEILRVEYLYPHYTVMAVQTF
jgi:hypothetical protein